MIPVPRAENGRLAEWPTVSGAARFRVVPVTVVGAERHRSIHGRRNLGAGTFEVPHIPEEEGRLGLRVV